MADASGRSERWPDLAALELLVAIAERGGLSAAARHIGMAQPNATRTLARLEKELALELVVRHPTGSRLTPAGAAVAEGARRVLDETREMLGAAGALRAERDGGLAVAASLTVAEYLAPAWLGALRRDLPGVAVRLHVVNSADAAELVRSRACEIGFVEAPEAPDGLVSTVVARDRLAVVVPPSHAWARRSGVSAAELAETPLVVRENGSGTRATLDTALASLHVAVAPPTLELDSNAAVRVSVMAGAGPAVLSELAVGPWVARGELVEVPIADLDLDRPLRAIRRPGAGLSEAAARLVAIARRG
ncbi:LysR family transcriptional regulator [Microbacterium sp. ASV49]|uniref:LysR family transcriptional regulator n=1 Tax=Microbacterium candidum TaxID=3041922 RepID=A0ABT7N498_9MICO|nr:LysR family transcriptional regulator [Microbacterium sp. ASV49]MDL9981532.1 LysR family transcriptional regulator [Microbacterium sp. ASV49]